MLKAAAAMVKCLEKENIKTVFGYPGAAICPFYDALSSADITHILVRHEQNAGHAASGYARITKKPAVCIATSGPGALNLITSIATAYMDSIPLVVITGQVSRDCLGRDVFQEADITGAAEPFVKHSYLVKEASDIPNIFKEAFFIASTGRQGPVLIDVPFDIQNEEIEFSYPETLNLISYNPIPFQPERKKHLNKILNALKRSRRPLICSGGGIISSNAQEELLKLSAIANIPVVTTMMGISSISPCCPLNLGMIGMHGTQLANKAMNTADLLILIGARVGDRAIMSPLGLSSSATIIHIDIDPAEIGKNIKTDISFVGDAKAVLTELIADLGELHFSDWISRKTDACRLIQTNVSKSCFVTPEILIAKLCEKLEPDSVITADVGQNLIWAARSYMLDKGSFLASCGMGTMGYSIPAAIGAKIGGSKSVVAICGDGGFQMSLAELATISQNKLDIKIILFNNSCLGMIKELQDRLYNKNETAVFLGTSPDYTVLASSYGINSRKIFKDGEIVSAIDEMLSSRTAFLLECIVDPNDGVV